MSTSHIWAPFDLEQVLIGCFTYTITLVESTARDGG